MSTESEQGEAAQRQAAINEALATSDACWRMEQEVLQRQLNEARSRAEYAERELSAAFDLPPSIGPAEGEAKRIVETLRRERDVALAEIRRLWDANESGGVLRVIFRGGYVEDESGERWWSAGLLSKVEQERDAARAEIERLRAERDSFYERQKGAIAEFSRREVHQRAYNAAFDREIERGKSPIEAAYIAGRVAYWDEAEAKGEP